MGHGIQGAVLKTLGATDHIITVTSKEQRTDHFVRITFHSDTLFTKLSLTPGAFVRCWWR
ncbi:MAG: hypothetical protein Q4A82_03405 [Corynebacterium sp.]|nr:hypothetical protein [Corynebacterium sp.]